MLTLHYEFVPFSRSRNAGEKTPSLNYKVTVKKDGRDVLTCDYMMGCGHCPAYRNPPTFPDGKVDPYLKERAVEQECETGRVCRVACGDHVHPTTKPIVPDDADVLESLAMDADVLNYGTFEEWAENFGYDADSRKAEGIYRECLTHALALRTAIGDDGIAKLRRDEE